MKDQLRDLSGTVVVVTGAGSGIGAATVGLLLEQGANVVAGELFVERLAQFVTAWGEDRIAAVRADVRDPDSVAQLLAAGAQRWGRVDSVVANAGIGYFGGLLDVDEHRVRTMVETNFLGSVWLARSAVEHFRAGADGGDIVVVGSVAGLGAGGGNEAVYAASKAAQIQFATSLDREVRSEGIRVSTVAPAAVNTAFAAATGRFGAAAPEDGGFLHAEDVAYAVVTTLQQPRRMRTALWSLWSLAEATG